MVRMIDFSSDRVKQWLYQKGYSVQTREEADIVEIKQNGTNVAEIVYFPEAATCFFLTQDVEAVKSCNLEKKSMFIEWNIATIFVVKDDEGNINFCIGI